MILGKLTCVCRAGLWNTVRAPGHRYRWTRERTMLWYYVLQEGIDARQAAVSACFNPDMPLQRPPSVMIDSDAGAFLTCVRSLFLWSIHNSFTCRISVCRGCHDLPRWSEFGGIVLSFLPDQLNGSVTQLNRKTRSDHCSRQLPWVRKSVNILHAIL